MGSTSRRPPNVRTPCVACFVPESGHGTQHCSVPLPSLGKRCHSDGLSRKTGARRADHTAPRAPSPQWAFLHVPTLRPCCSSSVQLPFFLSPRPGCSQPLRTSWHLHSPSPAFPLGLRFLSPPVQGSFVRPNLVPPHPRLNSALRVPAGPLLGGGDYKSPRSFPRPLEPWAARWC